MKYKCEKCAGEPPCFLETGADDCEWPFSCPYAIDGDDSEAEWKEYKSEEDKMKKETVDEAVERRIKTLINALDDDGKTKIESITWNCDNCVNNDETCSFCGSCDDGSRFERKDRAQKRGSILLEAHKIINGERQDSYGNPEDSFGLIGEYWTTYLQSNGVIPKHGSIKISKREVAEMMMLFKISRMAGQKTTLDNYTDLCGYSGIAADMVKGD